MSFKTEGDFEARVRESFAKQGLMKTLGVSIARVAAGEAVFEMSFDERLTQQHGFLHAGVITSVMDSAAGFAAMTLMPADAEVLTIELKSSLMRPAKGARFRCEGRVLKAGRSVMFTEARAYAGDTELAHMTASMMVIQGRAL